MTCSMDPLIIGGEGAEEVAAVVILQVGFVFIFFATLLVKVDGLSISRSARDFRLRSGFTAGDSDGSRERSRKVKF